MAVRGVTTIPAADVPPLNCSKSHGSGFDTPDLVSRHRKDLKRVTNDIPISSRKRVQLLAEPFALSLGMVTALWALRDRFTVSRKSPRKSKLEKVA